MATAEKLDLNHEISFGGGTTNWIVQYFYVLIAMACLFGCFLGLENATSLQANLSALGIRRSVSPTRKSKMVVSDFLAAVTLQYINILILLAYLVFVLKIDFGTKAAMILFTALIGVITGVALGTVIGVINRASSRMKDALLSLGTLFLSFLGGLMYGDMQDIIEHHVPIINRINPAALIKDAFYCLSVYDDYGRYTRNIVTLLGFSVLLCSITILVMRREKYASI